MSRESICRRSTLNGLRDVGCALTWNRYSKDIFASSLIVDESAVSPHWHGPTMSAKAEAKARNALAKAARSTGGSAGFVLARATRSERNASALSKLPRASSEPAQVSSLMIHINSLGCYLPYESDAII